MRIDVRTEFAAVDRLLASMPAKLAERATAPALNRAVQAGRTLMGREIRKQYVLSADFVRERLRVTAAVRRGGVLDLQAVLSARGKRGINVIRFMERTVTLAEGRRRARRGDSGRLYVRIRRGEGKKALPRQAFIGNAGRTVFMRVGRERLPIKAISTIDLPGMFNQRRINAAVVQHIRETFERRFAHEARRVLGVAL